MCGRGGMLKTDRYTALKSLTQNWANEDVSRRWGPASPAHLVAARLLLLSFFPFYFSIASYFSSHVLSLLSYFPFFIFPLFSSSFPPFLLSYLLRLQAGGLEQEGFYAFLKKASLCCVIRARFSLVLCRRKYTFLVLVVLVVFFPRNFVDMLA